MVVHDFGAERLSEEARSVRHLAFLRRNTTACHDAILSKTLDGVVQSWNRAAERLFGYSADAMIGHSIRRIIPDVRAAEEADTMCRMRSGEVTHRFESRRTAVWSTSVSQYRQ